MKKCILFTLPLSVLAIACAQEGPIQPMECQTMDIGVCQGTPDSPMDININVQSGLTVAPPNVCVRKGKVLDVKVTPPDTKVTVATVPKIPANTWMSGINIPDSGGFKIPVPGDLPDGDYDYHIVATNGYCYDPRIHVN